MTYFLDFIVKALYERLFIQNENDPVLKQNKQIKQIKLMSGIKGLD